MFAGCLFFAKVVDYLPGRNGANELLTSVRVLTGHEPFVLLALDFSLEFPLFGQVTTPASLDFTRFAIVVLLSVGEFLLVVVLGLARRERSAHGHHCWPLRN